ncbi:MAG: AAA family ATPase [Hyphomicrobiales bacterium]|nr:AAA family ATPase [Hyphomicrobiales bacterium]
MSSLAHDQNENTSANPQAGNLGGEIEQLEDIRPVPRVTIQAFCETESVSRTLEMTAQDRRMAKAHVKVHMGGIAAAVDFYSNAPTPNLIVVETKNSGSELINELGLLSDVCDSETKVVIIGVLNDIVMYRDLISKGISEYLVAPVSMADFMAVITNIYVSPESAVLGRTIAFIGAKGGNGSSTICHNIAWAVSSTYQTDVVLADTDLAFGTANINLDQDPAQGIAEAVFSADRVDEILLDRLLSKCAEHLRLLAAPSTLDRAYDFDKKAFSQVIDVAQRGVPYVIIDLPQQWNSWTMDILTGADEVVITACPDLTNLRNTKNLVDKLIELRPNDAKPKLILNQVGVPKRPEINVNDFIAPLDLQPLAIIPFEPALFGTAANNGQMISEADHKHAVSDSFDKIAQILTGKAEFKQEKSRSFDIRALLKRKKS